MPLSLQDVKKIAALARLQLTAEEEERYREQLSAVLDYAERLNEPDTADVPPTSSAVALTNVWREDIVEPSLPTEEALFNAARKALNQFQIQAVLDED
jgi:aspartyl-tRNA(Asn)/glutamyl-tRNA(Gln) amidotransferase subunit C